MPLALVEERETIAFYIMGAELYPTFCTNKPIFSCGKRAVYLFGVRGTRGNESANVVLDRRSHLPAAFGKLAR